MSWRRIMFAVPPQGSISQIELGKAVRLALSCEADLQLQQVIYSADILHPVRLSPAQEGLAIRREVNRCREELERVAYLLRARGVRVKCSVHWDEPWHEAVVRQALRHESDLLIVPRRVRDGAARSLLARADYRLIETCPCALLLLKTARPYLDPVIMAAVDPACAHRKPADLDDAILDAAESVCHAVAGRLIVCHACPPWQQVADRESELRHVPETVQADLQAAYANHVEARVQALLNRHRIRDGQIQVIQASAKEAILQVARRSGADVVTIGAVSRSSLRRLLVGHTSERVLDPLDSDVLIVKPRSFRTPVSAASTHHARWAS